ncbi:MAG: transcription termination factor Rho [Verrucomicrobia bacterium]|nr:MAG: transcription termination factor Rho [Verrucomicrobiota bacterium]TAE87251.1 MAG: transcription termination factor Rho [Verrucomicrobiota bacterium]TAF25086.1 MAG: transcription termination factor Rho [Verrucomicrobiota bacterium]
MSEPNNQETADREVAADASAAAKPSARKAAKKAAKKAAVKKTAVKKVARKTAKSAASDPLPDPPVSIQAEAAGPAPKARKVARKKVAATEPAVADLPAVVEARSAPESFVSSDSAEQRPISFGRVPGGGPVQSREDREPREAQHQGGHGPQGEAVTGERSDANRERRKRRRKRRRERDREGRGGEPQGERQGNHSERGSQGRSFSDRQERPDRQDRQPRDRHSRDRAQEEGFERPVSFSGPRVEVNGMLELAPKGFGFLRVPGKNFEQARDDVFVSPEMVRRHGLRPGVWIHGVAQEGSRGQQLVELSSINDLTPEQAKKLPSFDELKAVNPSKRISLETVPERFTTRVLDLMAPVGRGQRGLIVSPPRSGKTTLLLHIAEAVRELHDESLHLMVLLVDERPEEVTEFRRTLPGAEIYASSNDEGARSHCRIAELCIERAKRLVESGKHVFLLMDSITRLARAYNSGSGPRDRGRGIGTGGVMVGALEVPRRLFAAARNTREAGSLTILATALIQTNSRADEAIYQEFKGTGNMELVLDRKIAENYIYPAVDIFKSGTRREELLLPEHMLHKIHLIRRGLSGHRPVEAMERLLFFLKRFPNNPQMLLEIKG